MSSVTEVDVDSPVGAAAALRSTHAVRERAALLTQRARAGGSRWFTVHDDALESAAALVADVTRDSYPDLQIPFHSRWRHFEAGGVDRKAELLTGADARAMVDLTVVSVLLDAGAGPDWSYVEPGTGLRLGRSEGLGVASFHAFTAGLFSSDPGDPLRADAAGLAGLTAQRLGAGVSGRRGQPPCRARRPGGDPASAGCRAIRRAGGLRPRRPARRAARRAAHAGARLGARPRHPHRDPDLAGANLAWRQHDRRSAARRLLAPPGAGRPRPDRRAGCRFTSCRSGSPTRCSSRSAGPGWR